MTFTIDELSIISMYKSLEFNKKSEFNRNKAINELENNLPFVEDEEIKVTMKSSLEKLKTINDKEFLKLNLDDTLNNVSLATMFLMNT